MLKNKRAFTIIELLVVVLIIGILAAVALPQYQKAVEKSRIAEAMQVMSDIAKGIDLYLLENGYPESGTENLIGDEDECDVLNKLDIDVESSLACDEYCGYCVSQNFAYSAHCTNKGCWVWARPMRSFDDPSYFFTMRKSPTTGWSRGCDNNDDYGGTICESLAWWQTL